MQNKLEIINDFKNGMLMKDLALKYKISQYKINNMLFDERLKSHRTKHQNNDNYFDVIDSHEKAYILGFLIADGCIRLEKRKSGNFSKRICFSNSIDDWDVIKYIHDKICPEVKLITYHNTKGAINRKPQVTLQ